MDGQWKERGGQYMDLSDVLVDESNMNVLAGLEGESMKERLDVEKEVDPFWS